MTRHWEREWLELPEALQLVIAMISPAGADAAELLSRYDLLELNLIPQLRRNLECDLSQSEMTDHERAGVADTLQSLPDTDLVRETLRRYNEAASLLTTWMRGRQINGEGWHAWTDARAPISDVQWTRGHIDFRQNLIVGESKVFSPVTKILVYAADIRRLCEGLNAPAPAMPDAERPALESSQTGQERPSISDLGAGDLGPRLQDAVEAILALGRKTVEQMPVEQRVTEVQTWLVDKRKRAKGHCPSKETILRALKHLRALDVI